jgi:hypothetical protein
VSSVGPGLGGDPRQFRFLISRERYFHSLSQ